MNLLPLSIESLPALWRARLMIKIAIVVACGGLCSSVRAVMPAPDGGYPNGNTAEGENALFNLTTGANDTAIGFEALFSNTTGDSNTATGYQALFSNTTGGGNTASGGGSLQSTTTGGANTATGASSMGWNTTGSYNTASGAGALAFHTQGIGNTATGVWALSILGTGNYNTASGYLAMGANQNGIGGGSYNTASGYSALGGNGTFLGFNTGSNNTATGSNALLSNTTGNLNTANGVAALYANTTGIRNTATGVQALRANQTGTGNTAEGNGALSKNLGSYNTAVGYNAGTNLTSGHDNVDIQAAGVAGESNTTRIGTVKQARTFISGIRSVTTANANAVPVVIDSAGQLGTVSSSRRFKDEIKPMDNASEAILGLKPVRFHYKSDNQNTPQFGLIAEEVAKVNPDLVVRDDDGQIYTVRYEAVNAMLLNEFLKAHRKLEQQQTTIERQQKQIEKLTAGLQTVTARMETADSRQRVVSDN
jgi:hypothetical protein